MQAPSINLQRSHIIWWLSLALAASANSSCGGICENQDNGCLALRVLNNDNHAQVSVAILDAFGKQITRRRTVDMSAREWVEIPVDGYDPTTARCVRVSVGSGPTRKTGLLKVKNWLTGSRMDREVVLKEPPPKVIVNSLLQQGLTGSGRSVAIGRVPGAPGPLLVVGSAVSNGGKVEFFAVASKTIQPAGVGPLPVDGPPYPLVLAGNTDNSAVLLVGADPLGASGPPFVPPIVYGGQGVGFSGTGVKLSNVGGNANAQTTFVAAADLDADGQLEVVANWVDAKAVPRACGTVIFTRAGQNYTDRVPIPSLSGTDACHLLSALTLADVDGNGPDIIRSLGGELTVSLNMASGNFSGPINSLRADPQRDLLGLTTGDLNGDGILDIVVSTNAVFSPPNTDGTVVNYALGQPAAPASPTWREGSQTLMRVKPRAAVAIDLNGDFLDDVLVANYGDGTSMVQPSIVYGDSQQISVVDHLPNGTIQLYDVAAGDLNDDCQADIAFIGRSDNQVYVFLNQSIDPQ